jgi:LPS-assembly lipoprotein
MRRRAVLHRTLALAGSAALAGCGFTLSQPLQMPFSRIALLGFAPRSPIEAALREQLARSAVTVVAQAAQAQVLLQAQSDARERSVVASTAAGQVREIQLRQKLNFSLRTPEGRVLVPATELLLTRELSFTETQTLAKEREEATLYAEMQEDIVQQLMRRLAALRL